MSEVQNLAPSCPVCSGRESQRIRFGYEGRWLCPTCWVLFSGQQGEWDQMRDHRQQHENRKANEAADRERAKKAAG